MKGIVFTEFLDFVAEPFAPKMVDGILEDADLPHGGACTCVGTYSHVEMATLVGALSRRTGTPASDLLTLIGDRLCRRFVVKFPDFSEGQTGLFAFLASVDSHSHGEAHKLHPDAELPMVRMARRGAHAVDLDDESCRPLEALAEGMIRAPAEHVRQPVAISRSRIEGPAGAFVRSSIQHAA